MRLARHSLSLLFAACLTLHLHGQSLKVLVSVDIGNNHGINLPSSDLLLSGNRLFGTTYSSGTNGYGTIFSVNTDGTDFKTLYSFTADADGAYPRGHLVLAGSTVYGTANHGTNGGYGTIFSIQTNGTAFSVLHTMDGTNDGAYPGPGLILSGGTLYGTANEGGFHGRGTIFSMSTNGSPITVLHAFNPTTDGQNPNGGLVLVGGTIYGTAQNGGPGGLGTAYSMNTSGSNFTLIHVFSNSVTDGARPGSGFVLSGNMFYAATAQGGSYSNGTVYCMDTNGGGFHLLHSFRFTVDGYSAVSDLLLTGDTLYGFAGYGGANNGNGTIFSLNTNGGSFTLLHTFSSAASTNSFINLDGSRPYGRPVLSGNVLYGTTQAGGVSGLGTVFCLTILPTIINLHLSGPNITLEGINAIAGHTYHLLSCTNPMLPVVQWTSVRTNVLTSGGNFSITASNALAAPSSQQFFRLQVQ